MAIDREQIEALLKQVDPFAEVEACESVVFAEATVFNQKVTLLVKEEETWEGLRVEITTGRLDDFVKVETGHGAPLERDDILKIRDLIL